MSSDEWVDDVKPTLGEKIKSVLFPKHKKGKKHVGKDVKVPDPVIVNSVEPEKEVVNQDHVDEPLPVPVDSPKVVDVKGDTPPTEDEWGVRRKKFKKRVEADLSRGIPGNMFFKRVIATCLFLLYAYMLLVVVKYEPASTVVCILTLLIVLDYLAITRGKVEVWED
jgi:hypothetical protein